MNVKEPKVPVVVRGWNYEVIGWRAYVHQISKNYSVTNWDELERKMRGDSFFRVSRFTANPRPDAEVEFSDLTFPQFSEAIKNVPI